MKLLILTQTYPCSNRIYEMAFVHTRNLQYIHHKHEVMVVSFAAEQNYEFEGISVFTKEHLNDLIEKENFDAVISHAPNIRNHIRSLIPLMDKIDKLFFVFHGHEVLHTTNYYPEPYEYQKLENYFKQPIVQIYDFIKCKVLKWFISKYIGEKLKLIFVSNHLKQLAIANIGLNCEVIDENSKVIHNPVNEVFLENQYDWTEKKHLDFITIRPLNKSVYAIDLLMKLAKSNPFRTFYVYGEGDYFNYNNYPVNVKIMRKFLKPCEIPATLNKYKAAIMLSHHDTQGVMACEMAAFGIPIIVSNTAASEEMFADVKNKLLLNNDNMKVDLLPEVQKFKKSSLAAFHKKLSIKNTSLAELQFFKN